MSTIRKPTLRESGLRLRCHTCGATIEKFETFGEVIGQVKEAEDWLTVCTECMAAGEEIASRIARWADEYERQAADHVRWLRRLAEDTWVLPTRAEISSGAMTSQEIASCGCPIPPDAPADRFGWHLPENHPEIVEASRAAFVCAWCGVYDREERFDGFNHYTVCVHCGRSELQLGSRVEGQPAADTASKPSLRVVR